MATHGKSYTAPKGKPTRARGEGGRRSRIPPLLEWIVVGIVVLALMVVAWYFSVRGDGGTPHNGAGSATPAATAVGEPATTG